MKKAQGYISSQAIDGIWVPQHIQNQIIRSWCIQNSLEYILSVAEYNIGEYNQLKTALKTSAEYIVMYTIKQLPNCDKLIENAMSKKIISFASEDIICKDVDDIRKLKEIIAIKRYFNG